MACSQSRSRCSFSRSAFRSRPSIICGEALPTSGRSYLAYATSFLTIGGIWLTHHGIFRRLRYANRELMAINLLLLMAVVLPCLSRRS